MSSAVSSPGGGPGDGPPATSAEVRGAYLEAAAAAEGLIADPEVAARWDEPGALGEMTMGALAAHLARSVRIVEEYLDAEPSPGATRVDGPGYYAALADLAVPGSELNQGVVARSDAQAAEGPTAVSSATDEALQRLRARLVDEPAGADVAVFGWVMPLDEYLRTRCTELATHLDDLAVALGREPDVPDGAARVAVALLSDAAARRNGSLDALRALTRPERATPTALRVV